MDEIKFKLRPVEEKPKRETEKGDNTVIWIVFDTSKQGLETVMKDYSVMVMRFLWARARARSTPCLIGVSAPQMLHTIASGMEPHIVSV